MAARSLLAGIPCLLVPFWMCLAGYGAWLRMGFLMVLPALIGTGFLGLYAARWIRNLWRGRFNRNPVNRRSDRWLLLVFLGLSALSWTTGRLAREWHCRSIVEKAGPAIDALKKYEAAYGKYPSSLREVPDVTSLARAAGITVAEARVGPSGADVGSLEKQDMTVYLDPRGYCCVVPLERKVPMSFTRFYILRRDSGSPTWTSDHMIWTLTVRG